MRSLNFSFGTCGIEQQFHVCGHADVYAGQNLGPASVKYTLFHSHLDAIKILKFKPM